MKRVEELLEEIKALPPDDLQWLNSQLLQWYGRIAENLHLSTNDAVEMKKTAQHIIEEYIV